MKNIVLLLGLPGSGKGTQGKILSEVFMLPHISVGDVFRNLIKANTDESKVFLRYMNSGKLVPSKLVNKIIKKIIISHDYKEGCILDGYPRNLEQAKFISKQLSIFRITCIFLNISDKVAIERISGRYNCESCGSIYNKYHTNPQIEGICDHCKSNRLIFRSDDDENTVLLRLKEYREETLPLIEYYKKKERFFSIDANSSKEKIVEEIASIIKRI